MPSLKAAPDGQRFDSAVDMWLAVAMLLPLAVGSAMTAGALTGHVPFWTPLLVLVPQVLVVWILARTFYLVSGDTLSAVCGPFRSTVPLHTIRSLTATRSSLSAPALSLDRIAVAHSNGTLVISPRDKAGFIRAALSVNPTIAVHGLPEPTDSSSADDAPPSSFSALAVVPAVVVVVISVALTAFVLYDGMRSPTVELSAQSLDIRGLYSTTLARSDIVRIALEDQLGPTYRRSGFEANGELRGIFDVDGLGRCRLFVSLESRPYIVIHTTTQPVIVNFRNPARTRELYERLRTSMRQR